MTTEDILRARLANQQLYSSKFKDPAKLLEWMLAVQSQLYPAGKWGLGLRTPGSTEAQIDRFFDQGKILRTHVMRPTWHFVSPKDIKWLLKLTSPRVHQLNGNIYRKYGILPRDLAKGIDVICKSLAGEQYLTRSELQQSLEHAGIKVAGTILAYYAMCAELDGLICSGPRKGKQFTYALISERAPKAKELDDDEALLELTLRYFKSRGPATLADASWWSGLTINQIKRGVDALGKKLKQAVNEGKTYYLIEADDELQGPVAFLMPDYDEFGIAYKDRSMLSSIDGKSTFSSFTHWLMIDGRVAGTWTEGKKGAIEIQLSRSLSKLEHQAVDQAVARFKEFKTA